jgi:nucleoid DNA-binding protein
MNNKKKKGGRQVLISEVMAKGFTARKAREAVNAVIDCMKFALWCGEPVEITGGALEVKIQQGKQRRKGQYFQNIQTGKLMLRPVRYPGRRRVVKFTPDRDLDLTPLPAPPLPPPPLQNTPERVEARHLASKLLGRPADERTMAILQAAVEVHPWKPGALLRRLQEFDSRGWQFGDIGSLAAQVSAHYWD